MRRLEPFGPIPAWSAKPLLVKKKLMPWRKRPKRRVSNFARNMKEKQRLRYHYNCSNLQLRRYWSKAWKRGNERPMDIFMQICESRLDNFVWRVGLAPTMAAARFLVRQHHIQIMPPKSDGSYDETRYNKGWITQIWPSTLLKAGTKIQVKKKDTSQKMGRAGHDREPDIQLPDNITWDREKMEGSYNSICDPNQLGITCDENMLFRWFAGNRTGVHGRGRLSMKYFPGTYKEIPSDYNGGRIMATPENKANMKLGRGLNRHGRRRPPCQWGRASNDPLNNPYNEGKPTRAWWNKKAFPGPVLRSRHPHRPYAKDVVPGRHGKSGRI